MTSREEKLRWEKWGIFTFGLLLLLLGIILVAQAFWDIIPGVSTVYPPISLSFFLAGMTVVCFAINITIIAIRKNAQTAKTPPENLEDDFVGEYF